MSKTVNIDVHHVTRVEGHGNIHVNATDGKIEKIEWQVPEAPRFYEAMVRGHSFQDIQTIVSRICGICSITHSLAATKAIENAMGLTVDEQTDKMRILMHYSEYLQSHVLHIGYLAVPDFFGEKSVVPLVGKAPDAVKTVIKLHRLANDWSDLIAGRTTHPITLTPGGMTQFPSEAEMRELKAKLEASVPDLKAVLEVVLSVAGNIPVFERDNEYVSLQEDGKYSFYHGEITSTDYKGTVAINDWKTVANEYVDDRSTSKWCKWNRPSYMVGALARFNNQADHLLPLAKEVAKACGLAKGNKNPYMNTVAQLVEAVQVVEAAIQLIDELLTAGLKCPKVKVSPKAGIASGCVEAPRGILFHEYEFDNNGKCVSSDICIPTGQNHASIQHDFEKIVPEILDEGEDAVRQKLEMLVRAYDPCISCSTHALQVKFV